MYICIYARPKHPKLRLKQIQARKQANSNKESESNHAKASKHIQAQTGASEIPFARSAKQFSICQQAKASKQNNVRAAVGRHIWLKLDALKQLSAMATSRWPRWKAKAFRWMDQEEVTVTSAKFFCLLLCPFTQKSIRFKMVSRCRKK